MKKLLALGLLISLNAFGMKTRSGKLVNLVQTTNALRNNSQKLAEQVRVREVEGLAVPRQVRVKEVGSLAYNNVLNANRPLWRVAVVLSTFVCAPCLVNYSPCIGPFLCVLVGAILGEGGYLW